MTGKWLFDADDPDPVHHCALPSLVDSRTPGSRWQCECGLTWRTERGGTGRPGRRLVWRLEGGRIHQWVSDGTPEMRA